MNNLIKQHHNYIREAFDGTPTITITILNKEALITNSNENIWGKKVKSINFNGMVEKDMVYEIVYIDEQIHIDKYTIEEFKEELENWGEINE